MKALPTLYAFNRGVISDLALARTDIERLRFSAEIQSNWMPRILGSMMLRPGTEYLGSTKSNLAARLLPFIFASDDTAIIELTNLVMRVWVDETPITRGSVSSSVTNGGFTHLAVGWTDNSEAGGTATTIVGNQAALTGNGFNAGIFDQQVTVAGGDLNDEHALRVVVTFGSVLFRVGSTQGDDDYISETSLGLGEHSLAFTPTGNFHIRIQNRSEVTAYVTSCQIEAAGVMEIASPYVAADLSKIGRPEQSGDVVYLACQGYRQQKIERRGARSWSLVEYLPKDGPFRTENLTNIALTPSALTGNITMTASKPAFKGTNQGSLYRITSVGQKVAATLNGDNQFTDEVRVTGVGANRSMNILASGTYSATLTFQRSIGEPGAWEDVVSTTSVTSGAYLDGLDNQIIYYRYGIKSGDYTSGSIDLELSFPGGSIDGYFLATAYSSNVSMDGVVLKALGGTTGTTEWAEGAWSPRRGYPTSVCLYEGRLWWAGKDNLWGSVSDAYESFDAETEGDAGPISRSIGSGPVDVINWLLPIKRMVLGTAGAEKSVRSTSFDEPLTPTNLNIKDASTQGSAQVPAVIVDDRGIYVQRSGSRVYQLSFNPDVYDYASSDLSLLAPDFCQPGIVRIVVQRQPDTRVHCIRSDGTVAILVFDALENIQAWVNYETDGVVEDAVIFPGDEEDLVYYLVSRTINGSTVRYLERWAKESECQGETLNRQADSFHHWTGSSSTTITGLSHLEGEEVVVWANGKDLGSYTVASGQITGVSEAVTSAIVGLTYIAQFKSTKLAYAAPEAPLTQKKRVDSVGIIAKNMHALGLKYGFDFDHLFDLPTTEDGSAVDQESVHPIYDHESFAFDGEWNTDSRLCLQAQAPRPVTLLACVISMATHEKRG